MSQNNRKLPRRTIKNRANNESISVDIIRNYIETNYCGFPVIVDTDRKLINASKLWNTISSGIYQRKQMAFKDFLETPIMKEILEKHPEAKPIKLNSISKRKSSQLNGKYMPFVVAHYIMSHFNKPYTYENIQMITEAVFDKKITEPREHSASTKSMDTVNALMGIVTQLLSKN